MPLNGEVEWDYQRREVKRMARNVRGVVGIPSTIAVTAAASAPGIASVGSHLAISRGTHGRWSGRQPWDSGLNGSEPRFADDDGLPKPPRCRGSYPGGCWARWRKARASRSWPSRSPWSHRRRRVHPRGTHPRPGAAQRTIRGPRSPRRPQRDFHRGHPRAGRDDRRAAGRGRLPASAVPDDRHHLGDQGHPHGGRGVVARRRPAGAVGAR